MEVENGGDDDDQTTAAMQEDGMEFEDDGEDDASCFSSLSVVGVEDYMRWEGKDTFRKAIDYKMTILQ